MPASCFEMAVFTVHGKKMRFIQPWTRRGDLVKLSWANKLLSRHLPRARLRIKTFICFIFFLISCTHKTSSCYYNCGILVGFHNRINMGFAPSESADPYLISLFQSAVGSDHNPSVTGQMVFTQNNALHLSITMGRNAQRDEKLDFWNMSLLTPSTNTFTVTATWAEGRLMPVDGRDRAATRWSWEADQGRQAGWEWS